MLRDGLLFVKKSGTRFRDEPFMVLLLSVIFTP